MSPSLDQSTAELLGDPRMYFRAMMLCLFLFVPIVSPGQSTPLQGAAEPASTDPQHLQAIEQRLNDLTAAVERTQQSLQKSLLEIQSLRAQLEAMRAHGASSAAANEMTAEKLSEAGSSEHTVITPKVDDIQSLHEEQEALQAEIKQHDQIKVETSSKYPLRVTGLVLFNAFTNVGVVDDAQLPTVALPRQPYTSHGSTGASMRQTLLGLEATGPTVAGARSAAEVSMDFFGGVSSNMYGYNTAVGTVRMRQSKINLDWYKTSLEAGYTGPLISPLSPTSYATVAQPALSGSGNLWNWSPQARLEQRIPLSDQRAIAIEGGLIYPESPGYNSAQLISPTEASRRPAYEGRLSYRDSGTVRQFVLGVGAYSGRQSYSYTTIHAWAVTGDWHIPLSQRVELSGEIYRGRAIGGLGGGAYKDVLTGTDTITGLARTTGVEAAGGWSQLKFRIAPTFEANVFYGLDDAFSRNFDRLLLDPSTNPFQLYTRNSSIVGNIVFRPRTYFILSPEYRRVLSWSYAQPRDVANIFTITAGYQF